MKKSVFFILAVALLASCQSESFKVKGVIAGAAPDDMVYLEHMAPTKVELLDSCKLNKNLAFSFREERPQYPEIYRLRVNNKTVILAVDSIDEIEVNASYDDILKVTFEGSPKSAEIAALRRSLREQDMDAHKQFARECIIKDPASVVAYYALFQTKAGEQVFDLFDKDDRRMYQAVATSWNAWMPKNPRTKILYNQVLEQMNAERRQLNAALMQAFIEEQENSFLDIVLPDENGDEKALSQLQGKVILLDFCSLEIEGYKDYLFSLRDRYNAYHAKGLEIYQVYPDQNRLLWENQVEALPWTTVRTENGIANSCYRTYNVQTIPTIFLLNRKGEVVGRFVGFAGLNEAIEKVL